jgi:hypothetical protein
MGTAIVTIQNQVYNNLGRDSADEYASVAVPAAVEAAVELVSLLFKPAELFTSSNQTVSAGSSYYSLDALDPLRVVQVRNRTVAKDMHELPFAQRTLAPTPAYTKYYSLHGQRMYLKKVPSSDTRLTIWYIKRPNNAATELEFEHYDALVVGLATLLCHATFEEVESSNLWKSVSDLLGEPEAKELAAQEIMSSQLAKMKMMIGGQR